MKITKSILSILLALSSIFQGCMRNPVTGQREIAFIPATTEIYLGAEQFLPMQQAQGGVYLADQEVSEYVSTVGQKLADVSDRPDLPFEFVVLNNSVPNAWTLPGGKIAINRGLLVELQTEAELAAVLSHEIVHAAARHGAKSLERGLAFQAGMVGLGTTFQSHKYQNAIIGGATVGTALITYKYSRNAEFEADNYGIKYMSKAGYDVSSAVCLQETFLRLSEGKKSSWVEGLFATHPPSKDRIEENRRTAQYYPEGGFIGREEYQAAIAHLIKTKEAYQHLDKGYAALDKGSADQALQFANEGLKQEPNEAQFYGVIGKALAIKKDDQGAIQAFSKAIELNNSYFDYYLQRGLLYAKATDKEASRKDLNKSISLLPTAGAHFALGELDLSEGLDEKAIEHFNIAAQADNEIGEAAKKKVETLEAKRQPQEIKSSPKS